MEKSEIKENESIVLINEISESVKEGTKCLIKIIRNMRERKNDKDKDGTDDKNWGIRRLCKKRKR